MDAEPTVSIPRVPDTRGNELTRAFRATGCGYRLGMTTTDGDATPDVEERMPDPDDPRKPDSPGDLTKPSVLFVLRKTAREFSQDQCTDLAAALTYYAVLSLF